MQTPTTNPAPATTRTAGSVYFAELLVGVGDDSAVAFVTAHGAELADCVVAFSYAQALAAYYATRNAFSLGLCRNAC